VPLGQIIQAAASFDIGLHAIQATNPNNYYCLPNKVFEYMMAGLALAVSDLPELRRIVHGYNTGITFEPSNPEDIARQINSLLANPEQLYQMQASSLRASRDVFNFEREGEKLRQIIEDVIGLPAMEA
jgi:glycosyltransferase involved in cell wall biosynthesis